MSYKVNLTDVTKMIWSPPNVTKHKEEKFCN